MMSRSNIVGWIGEKGEENTTVSTFKSMLEVENEWYNIQNTVNDNIILNQIDSSSSCSPSPVVFNDPTQVSFFSPQKASIFTNPLPQNIDLECGSNVFFTRGGDCSNGVLGGFSEFGEMGCPSTQFTGAHFVSMPQNEAVFDGGSRFRGFEEGMLGDSVFGNRVSKLLKPLDNSAPAVGAQPTLFQKRAARKLSSGGEMRKEMVEIVSIDGSVFNYDSDDFTENNNKGDENARNSNANSTVTGAVGAGDSRGKKKGLPAKNLMAERRRRKKLNDRLYMLRSVVPKISKMDRASILGDAIDYLKELLQKISDLHNELESSPSASSLAQTTSFHPLTPTLPNLPSRIKEELCPSSVASPSGQPARIEVRLREGRDVNIHMFCGRRPGLLLSTMRALDGLGLDIQEAVISCFNGFAMDVFRAEQCKNGVQDVHPEQIKALLLDIATLHGSSAVGNCDM